MLNKRFSTSILVGLAALSIPAVAIFADEVDYTKMTPEELAEYLIFEAGGFKLDQEVHEGGTARQWMVQDDVRKTCSNRSSKMIRCANAPTTPNTITVYWKRAAGNPAASTKTPCS